MGVAMSPCWVRGTSRTTSLPRRTWMVSDGGGGGARRRRGIWNSESVAVEAGAFDVEVLDVGAEVGEAPGDVVVVADDDEGRAGKGDSGYVEGRAGGGRGFEVGLVPDAGDAVGEVHVV